MNKKILSLILAVVMVVALLPANVLAVQSGFTADPDATGSLTATNPATAHPLSGPMTLGGASAPVPCPQCRRTPWRCPGAGGRRPYEIHGDIPPW